MRNQEVADMLYEIADFLEIDDVEYKPRAYRTAARNIESLSEPIEDVHERQELEDIEGVGESIAEKIAEYLETGDLAYYDRFKTDLPIDIEAITSVEGVGPKTAKTLYEELNVATLEDLERAAAGGQIATLEGFGETSQQNILQHIDRAKEGQERMLLGRAVPIACALETRLKSAELFDRLDIVGSFRRRRPTVGDLDILATSTEPDSAVEAFCTHDDVTDVLARGETKASVVASGGVQLDLRIVDDAEYGAAAVYFTGSKDHNITLRERAIDRGWKLNEYGLFDVRDVDEPRSGQRVGTRIASATEEAIYDALGLSWIPPELREGTGEIAAAAADTLPTLIAIDAIRGDLHLHTASSDGSYDVRAMAEAADDRGRDYVLIADYGPHVPGPATLDAAGFADQQAEIEAINADESLAVTVLQGVEAEITETGLEVSTDWLDACDLVIAGIHSYPADPTERVLRALREAPVDILAHPTARRLTERNPLEIDMDAVVETAAREQVAIEINAQPERLDLPWQAIKPHRETVQYVVSTAARTPGELDHMHLGVSQARRGWCGPADIVNTRPMTDALSMFDG